MENQEPAKIDQGVKEFQEFVNDVQGMSQASKHVLGFIRDIVMLIMYVCSFPAFVFFHHRFGERYFNAVNIVAGGAGLLATAAITRSPFGPSIFWFYVLLVMVHWCGIIYRNKKGTRWHSRCWGVPWLSYLSRKLNTDSIVGFYQPVLLALIGFYWLYLSAPEGIRFPELFFRLDLFGVYFFVAGIGMAVVTYLTSRRARMAELDQIDSQIEAENMAMVMEQNPSPTETEGFAMPGL